MYTPMGPIVSFQGMQSYSSFAVSDREQTLEYWLSQWSTPEQRRFNDTHDTCPVCRGRGYKVYRRGGQTVRESVGCQSCLGLGAVKIEEFRPIERRDAVVGVSVPRVSDAK